MARIDHHRTRANEILKQVPTIGIDGVVRVTGRDQDVLEDWRTRGLGQLDPTDAVSVAVLLIEKMVDRDGWWSAVRLLPSVSRRRLPYESIDVELLFVQLLRIPPYRWELIRGLKLAVGAADRLGSSTPWLAEMYRRMIDVLDQDQSQGGDRARLRSKLVALRVAGSGAASQPTNRVDLAPVRRDDGWAAYLADLLAGERSDAGALSTLLSHASALSGPRPTKTWMRTATAAVAAADGLDEVVHRMLAGALSCDTVIVETQWGHASAVRVGPGNADLLRGVVWCAMAIDPRPDWLIDALADLTAASMRDHTKVASSTIAALGAIGSAQAIGALARIQRSTRDRGHLKAVAKALDAAADQSGMSRSELLETTVLDSGLDVTGRRPFVFGEVTATLILDRNAKVTVEWDRAGERLRSMPADIKEAKPPELTDLKAATSALRALVSTERARLESLITEDRTWTVEQWSERYLSHPVTATLARRLLWSVEPPNSSPVVAVPGDDGRWSTSTGDTLTPARGAAVSPWHPLLADPAVVHDWRRRLEADEVRQPFKQAFREIYLLTPAEEATGVYSNRFAAHVLDYPLAYALMKERGWATNFLGPWDGGYDGVARREFAEQGVRAEFFHDAVEPGRHAVVYCATDQVRFCPLGRAREAMPVRDVPPMVFSEAMRDVDLFVGVASIANDPTWADRGTERGYEYWERAAFGDLTASAETRRDVLEHLLPKVRIADVARLDGRFLEVIGTRHTYRIHLGSGNILMSPNDRYLCIVPDRSPSSRALRFVPFEGDGTLAVILSKALMLAADDKIKDPQILRQL
jgi:hypothetical protein